MNTWPLQDAKSRFSELVDKVLSEGPQAVTRRGAEAVVVVAAADFRRLTGQDSLLSTLLNAPRGTALEVERSRELIRTVDL
ncbi:MAG: type II toxin-antitoxin system Phd/YefM family antitoxin [Giesbergeria sp.]|jgi:prevent-host-death family protein